MHDPKPCPITAETELALRAAIRTALPDARTGAAFVTVDTRVLAALIEVAGDARVTIRMSNPDDELFVDSGADCLQYLLENVSPIVGGAGD